jgi:subtilisin family serine protease
MADDAGSRGRFHGSASPSDRTSGFTGRHVVVFSDDVTADVNVAIDALKEIAGVYRPALSSDYASGADSGDPAAPADAVIFERLGVAVVSADPAGAGDLAARCEADARILAVEPERILYAIEERPLSLEYVRGFRDGVSCLYDQLKAGGPDDSADPGYSDNDSFTWGLQATQASVSSQTGADIAVAVLDTGFDLEHPDFAGRTIVSQSFVAGQPVQDGHGHGTHCVGISCGPKAPPGSRRYGVAPLASIYVGKVLNNEGSGTDSEILAGIDWALTNGVHVISMSLGADVQEVSQTYETVGRRALDAGTLIVAAAGNNAERSAGNVGFVGMPANSPSIMAIGAIDSALQIADFSARSSTVEGGKVDLAAPGVDVYSSWMMPTRYRSISGTSMATPHVAGVAALLSQASGVRGAELWTKLTQTARPMSLESADVGAGLVQAPA